MVPLKIVSNVSRFKPTLNLNQVLADLNRGSNSLNSFPGLFYIFVHFLVPAAEKLPEDDKKVGLVWLHFILTWIRIRPAKTESGSSHKYIRSSYSSSVLSNSTLNGTEIVTDNGGYTALFSFFGVFRWSLSWKLLI